MQNLRCTRWVLRALCALAAIAAPVAAADWPLPTLFREQRSIEFRPPPAVPGRRLPSEVVPKTVARDAELAPLRLTLDEAIRTALANADVVRILAGVTATSSGRTIYDPAVFNAAIDQQQARFDPALNLVSNFNRVESPVVGFDPKDPSFAFISGLRNDSYAFRSTINKQNALGGVASMGVATGPSRLAPGIFPLNPENRTALELQYTQPLLQGAGIAPNLAPIVVARINTERSYYQLKDSVQESVRGVIEAYWALVFARVDVWVRERQVEQATEALRVADGRFRAEVTDIAEVTQARTALANFRASLVGAQANQIQREAALRNIMGIPPTDGTEYVPVTPPRADRLYFDWQALCELAAEMRPDLIDLQMTLEADEHLLVQARNQALPRTDAVLLYRFNGIDGTQPNGRGRSAGLGEFQDWTFGLTVSVPFGQRQSRAALRQQELFVMRDRVNLQQGLHNAAHLLATTVRAIDQGYEQYLAFIEARKAARINLQRQLAQYRTGRTIYLNVLLAITDWGNSISSEANALLQYNTQLANLERQSGTILETHGVYFLEEQYGSLGPLGRLMRGVDYPAALFPEYGPDRYPAGNRPADEEFDLEQPEALRFDAPLPDLDYKELLRPRRNGRPAPPPEDNLNEPEDEPIDPAAADQTDWPGRFDDDEPEPFDSDDRPAPSEEIPDSERKTARSATMARRGANFGRVDAGLLRSSYESPLRGGRPAPGQNPRPRPPWAWVAPRQR